MFLIVDVREAEAEADLHQRRGNPRLRLLHEGQAFKGADVRVSAAPWLVHPPHQHRLCGGGNSRWRDRGAIVSLHHSEVMETLRSEAFSAVCQISATIEVLCEF